LTDYSSWVATCGLLRADFSPKPAYDALKKLIHDTWRTEAKGKTDENGIYRFRGFHGEYDVQIESPAGDTVESGVHVRKGEDNRFRIVLSGGS